MHTFQYVCGRNLCVRRSVSFFFVGVSHYKSAVIRHFYSLTLVNTSRIASRNLGREIRYRYATVHRTVSKTVSVFS